MTRRGFLKGLLGITLAGLFAAIYGFIIAPAIRLRVRKWSVRRADWSAPALRIVAVSDIHLGEPHVGLRRLRQVVRRANALNGDVIVLLGDYAAGHHFVTKPVKFADAAPELSKLTAPQGVYAILGNHDWWDDLDAQKRGGGPNLYAVALQEQGITVLSNQAVRKEGYWLAGLEDQLAIRKNGGWTGLDDLPKTLSQVSDTAPVVMLAHEPDIFAQMPERVAITLSGHTHGGQVRVFGWSPVVPSRFGNRYAYGHVREGTRDLIVSGGIGCSILPVRFGVAPEITVIDIAQA